MRANLRRGISGDKYPVAIKVQRWTTEQLSVVVGAKIFKTCGLSYTYMHGCMDAWMHGWMGARDKSIN